MELLRYLRESFDDSLLLTLLDAHYYQKSLLRFQDESTHDVGTTERLITSEDEDVTASTLDVAWLLDKTVLTLNSTTRLDQLDFDDGKKCPDIALMCKLWLIVVCSGPAC